MEHCAFMVKVSLFHGHMDGLFLTPIDDVGERILQWRSQIDRKKRTAELLSVPIWLDDYDLRRYRPSEIGGKSAHVRSLVAWSRRRCDTRPFYIDPAYVTSLNIAITCKHTDTDETVVQMIVQHDFSKPRLDPFIPRLIPMSSTSAQKKYRRTATGPSNFPPIATAAISTTRQPTDVNEPARRATSTFRFPT